MIQPDFCRAIVLCDGCDEETDTAVWFLSMAHDKDIKLCSVCCAALLFTSSHHPKRRVDGPPLWESAFTLRP